MDQIRKQVHIPIRLCTTHAIQIRQICSSNALLTRSVAPICRKQPIKQLRSKQCVSHTTRALQIGHIQTTQASGSSNSLLTKSTAPVFRKATDKMTSIKTSNQYHMFHTLHDKHSQSGIFVHLIFC